MKRVIVAVVAAAAIYASSAFAAVDINTANADQLAGLTGVGPVKAESIIEEREANGDFETVDGLTRVSGVGDKTVESLRSEATVKSGD